MPSQIIPPFPYKNCPDRYPACHDKCEKYLTVKRAHDEKREALWKEKMPDEYAIDRVFDKKDRAAKRRRDIAGVRKSSK